MKRMMLLLTIVAVAGCNDRRGMETRTYEIARLTDQEAIELITPYIRDGGSITGKNRLITVRERDDRLKVVEDLLEKYDGAGQTQDVAMRIQIVEANGFTERDSAIADVEQTLREMFKYDGYRLSGETQIRAREESSFEQDIGNYRIQGNVGRLNGDRGPVYIGLWDQTGTRRLLSSTITATMGKPVVLGQSAGDGAIILILRPELAGT